MFATLLIAGVTVTVTVLALLAGLVREEHRAQREQRRRADGYFASRDQRHALQEAAARSTALAGANRRQS